MMKTAPPALDLPAPFGVHVETRQLAPGVLSVTISSCLRVEVGFPQNVRLLREVHIAPGVSVRIEGY